MCLGRGLVPSFAAVMESALLAVAAGVGASAAIRSWRWCVMAGMEFLGMVLLKIEQCANINRISSLCSSAS